MKSTKQITKTAKTIGFEVHRDTIIANSITDLIHIFIIVLICRIRGK